MTSVKRRLNLGILVASVATFLAGVPLASAQQPVYVSPSPYVSTTRLPGSSFSNSGLTSVGFQNTGFRNSGFQNVGFRNTAPINSAATRYWSGGSSYAPYAPGGYSTPNNGLAGNQGLAPSPVMNNTAYNQAPQQYGAGVVPGNYYQGQGYAADDTATIVVGPGTNLNSGVTVPPLSRGARYTVGLGFDSPVGTTNPRLSEELQKQFTNSQRFGASNNIKVAVENNVVVLKGKVADDHERDLAEIFVRLSPGVYDVRNDLQVESGVASENR